MWHRLVLGLVVGLVVGLVLAGCGFRSPAVSNGGPGDAAVDGPGGGSGDGSSAPPGCFGRWLDGSVAIDAMTVKEVTELSSTGLDLEPWVSNSGLHIYFSRDLAPPGHGDIYFASRDTPTGTFGAASPVTNLNTTGQEGRAWLTSDELAIALSTTHDGPLGIDMTTRMAGQQFGTPGSSHLAMVNAQGMGRLDPFLTDDLKRLYFSADTGPASKLQLWIATRAAATDDFDAVSLVPGSNGPSGVNSSALTEFGPALYQDERLLLFSGGGNEDTSELFYATRASAADGFDAAASKIPTVNTSFNEIDPVLSQDGCELYFASDRDSDGHYHLFRAQITR